MQIHKTEIQDCYLIDLFHHTDVRGEFIKPFRADVWYQETGIEFNIKEIFYSLSQKNVLRGMHFQIPPHAHHKIVYLSQGSALDVVVDIRPFSTTYLKTVSFNLDAKKPQAVFIPIGLAHGFLSKEDNTMMTYLTTHENFKETDAGVLYNSVDFDWGNTGNYIISDRDKAFPKVTEYTSTF